MKRHVLLLMSALALFVAPVAFTSTTSLLYAEHVEEAAPVKASLHHEEETIQPGKSFWVITRLQMDENWHAYWKNPGDAGMAPEIEWQMPEGFTVSDITWPYPQRFTADSMVGFGYDNEVLLLSKITPPISLTPGENVTIGAEVNWVACSNDTCLPGNESISMTLAVKNKLPAQNARSAALFAKARTALPKEAPEILVKRKTDTIEMLLPQHGEYQSAYFCPEEDQSLDFHVEPTLLKDPDHPQHFVLQLKDAPENKSQYLAGVLVTQNKNGSEAFTLNIPIEDITSDEALISMANPTTTANVVPSQHVEFEGGVGLAILFAFLGGMILNLMPCVLPVISFKVLSFVKMAGQSRSLTLKHGLMFSLGVLISFWALAGVLLVMQAYGNAVGWGFQLQEPLFVASLAAVLLVFGLSLFGVFELGTSLATKAGQAQSNSSGLFGSFMSGILATAVATPCTGPFLGSALGFAVTLPAHLSMLIFTSLGIGMAFPYLILAAYPNLLRFLPKPGNWMITFKEIMGFLMLATVIWLIWVFSAQTNYMAVTMLLAGFFFMSIGCWIYGKWATPIKKRMTRIISTVITLACFLVGANVVYTATTPWVEAFGGMPASHVQVQGEAGEVWEEFSPERVAELQKQGVPVFVDFTAKWCLICQTNHMALSTDSVKKEFMKKGIVKMKADWTKRDPVITEALRKFGRSGVPLYVLYDSNPEHTPEILPQVLTPETVVDYLNKDSIEFAKQD